MYIGSLILENFKKYEKKVINLDPAITLLVGPNSSGKSSIIKAILGIKQSLSQSNEGEVFAGLGEYVDLGTYADYVYNHDKSKSISVGLKFGNYNDYAPKTFMLRQLHDLISLKTFMLKFTFDYDYSTDQARIKTIIVELASDRYSGEYCRIERKQTRSTYRFSLNNTFLTMLDKFDTEHDIFDRPTELLDRYVDLIHISKFKFTEGSKKAVNHEMRYARYIFENLTEIASNILTKETFYLGPLRKSPSRSYVRTAHNVAVGPTGEHTPSVLANLQKKKQKATTGKSVYTGNLELLNKWLNEIFPGNKLNACTIEELVKLKVTSENISGLTLSDNISDVGFGMSQVVPVLVQAAVMAPGNTLVIEQPELHLHPMAQHALARIIADAAKTGRRFIIETHSEHFIRGLQVAISENAIEASMGIPNTALNTIYIYGVPIKLKYLEIDNSGSYREEWPSGFFDEGYNITYKLMKNKSIIASRVKGGK